MNLLAVANEVSGTTTVYTIMTNPPRLDGDVDGNGIVDRTDMRFINFHRNQPADALPAADMDSDGMITALDARKMVWHCTLPGCRSK